jgi:hypothetical protein
MPLPPLKQRGEMRHREHLWFIRAIDVWVEWAVKGNYQDPEPRVTYKLGERILLSRACGLMMSCIHVLPKSKYALIMTALGRAQPERNYRREPPQPSYAACARAIMRDIKEKMVKPATDLTRAEALRINRAHGRNVVATIPPIPERSKRSCIICGSQFTPSSNQKICSETCRREHARIYDRNYRRASRAKAPLAPRSCASCGASFMPRNSLQKRCSQACPRPRVASKTNKVR